MSEEKRFEFELMRCWSSTNTRFRLFAEGPVNSDDLRKLSRLLEQQISVLDEEASEDEASEKKAPEPAPPNESVPL